MMGSLLVSMSYGQWCRKQVRVGDGIIRLTDQEHKLVVELLSRHPEHWVSCPTLLDTLWAHSRVPDRWLDVIHTTIFRCRGKGVPIEGRRGAGSGGIRIHCRGRVALVTRVSCVTTPRTD